MRTYSVKLFFLYILSIGFINHVRALKTEAIFNGQKANPAEYRYQAGIYGIQQYSNTPEVLGSGVVVGDHHVLSAAHLFVDMIEKFKYTLKPMTFYVCVNADDLTGNTGRMIYVEKVYVYEYNANTGSNDVIGLKLSEPFVLTATHNVHPAEVYWEGLDTQEGVVSSYGVHNSIYDKDYQLRYASAKIVQKNKCDNILHTGSTQMCVKMKKTETNRPRGLCDLDAGAPLVISKVFLMGIAGKPKQDCDDTEKGSIYTDLRPLNFFIQQILIDVTYGVEVIDNNPRRTDVIL